MYASVPQGCRHTEVAQARNADLITNSAECCSYTLGSVYILLLLHNLYQTYFGRHVADSIVNQTYCNRSRGLVSDLRHEWDEFQSWSLGTWQLPSDGPSLWGAPVSPRHDKEFAVLRNPSTSHHNGLNSHLLDLNYPNLSSESDHDFKTTWYTACTHGECT